MADKGQDDLESKVLKALRATGYPLELRVAKTLRDAGAHYVNQSRHYVDRTTEKVREIDAVAVWRERRDEEHVFTYLVAECKSKPRPWVVFDANEGATADLNVLFDTLYTVEIGMSQHSDSVFTIHSSQQTARSLSRRDLVTPSLKQGSEIGKKMTTPTGRTLVRATGIQLGRRFRQPSPRWKGSSRTLTWRLLRRSARFVS